MAAPERVAGSADGERSAVADGLSADDTVGAACVAEIKPDVDGDREWLAEEDPLKLRPLDTDAIALNETAPVAVGRTLPLAFALAENAGETLADTQTVALCVKSAV